MLQIDDVLDGQVVGWMNDEINGQTWMDRYMDK